MNKMEVLEDSHMARYKVDYPHIKANGNFAAVLAAYNIRSVGEGSQIKALCPFHDDKKPSLSINTEKNVFHCWACEAKGNLIDFVMKFDDLKVRPAAIKVAEISGIATHANGAVNGTKVAAEPAADEEALGKAVRNSLKTGEPLFEDEDDAVESDGVITYNKPLSFQLKLLHQVAHPFLTGRKISEGVMETFGLGFAQKGVMKDRLAIPIHNHNGEIVAYCGRWPDDEQPEDEPKYLFPSGFKKELELFNIHRCPKGEGSQTILIVESFLSVFAHCNLAIPVVSPMGRSISPQQIELLKQWGVKRACILFDGDQPGRDGALTVAGMIASAGLWAKVGHTPDGMKPHQMTHDEVAAAFQN